jgi:fluoroquinolone resistance protein
MDLSRPILSLCIFFPILVECRLRTKEMTPEELSNFSAQLKDNTKFNSFYSSGNFSVDDWHWPSGEYKSLKFNQFTFSNIAYKQGITFQNCQFSNCRFIKSKFENTQFKNCTFENCSIENSSFEASLFDSSIFRNCTFQNCELGDRKIGQTQFRMSSLVHTSFKKVDFNGVVFEKSKTEHLSIEHCDLNDALFAEMLIQPSGFVENRIEELNFVGCTLHKEIPEALLFAGKTNWNSCWIDSLILELTDDLMLKINEFGLRSCQLKASPGMKSLSFGPLVDSKIAGNSTMEELNFIGANVERSNIHGFKGILMRSGLDAALTDTHLENLDFEEIEWDQMTFTRCTLKNIRARKSLNLDKTQFIDCKFENFTLDAGGTYSAKGTPFESGLPK